MELLFIVLNEKEFLMDILDAFVEKDIRGATVVDSSGMCHLVSGHIPFFSHFAEIDGDKNHSKTIFAVVDGEGQRNKAVAIVEEVLGDLNRPDSAFIFSVPVNFVKGSFPCDDGSVGIR